MAIEHWVPFEALRVRLLLCGHVYDADPAERINATLINCKVCQRPHVGPGSADDDILTPLIRIPTDRLMWDGLTRQKVRKTRRRKQALVCSTTSYSAPIQLTGRSVCSRVEMDIRAGVPASPIIFASHQNMISFTFKSLFFNFENICAVVFLPV